MNLELCYLVASMVFQMVWKVTVQGIFLTHNLAQPFSEDFLAVLRDGGAQTCSQMNRWISQNSLEICRSARHWIYSSPSCEGIIWYKWWHTACWTSLAKVKDSPMPFMDFSFDGGDRSRMEGFSLFVSRHGECLGARTCQGESEDEAGNRKPALRHSEVLWVSSAEPSRVMLNRFGVTSWFKKMQCNVMWGDVVSCNVT